MPELVVAMSTTSVPKAEQAKTVLEGAGVAFDIQSHSAYRRDDVGRATLPGAARDTRWIFVVAKYDLAAARTALEELPFPVEFDPPRENLSTTTPSKKGSRRGTITRWIILAVTVALAVFEVARDLWRF